MDHVVSNLVTLPSRFPIRPNSMHTRYKLRGVYDADGIQGLHTLLGTEEGDVAVAALAVDFAQPPVETLRRLLITHSALEAEDVQDLFLRRPPNAVDAATFVRDMEWAHEWRRIGPSIARKIATSVVHALEGRASDPSIPAPTPGTAPRFLDDTTVRRDPWLALKPFGPGFNDVDALALKEVWWTRDSMVRAEHAIMEILNKFTKNGSNYVTAERFERKCQELLDERIFMETTKHLVECNKIFVTATRTGTTIVTRTEAMWADRTIHQVCTSLPPPSRASFNDGMLNRIGQSRATDEQRMALEMAASHTLSAVVGAGGTGKTDVCISGIAAFAHEHGQRVIVAAPTHVVRKLLESTLNYNLRVRTVAALVYALRNGLEVDMETEGYVEWVQVLSRPADARPYPSSPDLERALVQGQYRFTSDEWKQLGVSTILRENHCVQTGDGRYFVVETSPKPLLLIVDEASMIGSFTLATLLEQVVTKRTGRVVLFGDAAQLLPLQEGAPFYDLVYHFPSAIPMTHLTRVFRSSGNTLAQFASIYRPGPVSRLSLEAELEMHSLCVEYKDEGNVASILRNLALRYNEEDCLCITPTNEGCREIHRAVRAAFRWDLEESSPPEAQPPLFRPGDTCYTKTNETYFKNGDKGIVVACRTAHTLTACFTPDAAEVHAYEELSKAWAAAENGEVRRALLRTTPFVEAPERGQEKGTWNIVLKISDVLPGNCITIHKAQGQQRRVVVVFLPASTTHMASMDLVYTSVSRAKEHLILVGPKDIFRRKTGRKFPGRRDTLLRLILEDALDLEKLPEGVWNHGGVELDAHANDTLDTQFENRLLREDLPEQVRLEAWTRAFGDNVEVGSCAQCGRRVSHDAFFCAPSTSGLVVCCSVCHFVM